MKRYLLLSLSILSFSWTNAQVSMRNYTEGKESIKALSFDLPVCTENTIISNWKTYISQQKGVAKGGIINKVRGENMSFNSERNWIGNIAYSSNNKMITIFISFKDLNGKILTDSSPDYANALTTIKSFRHTLERSCLVAKLNNAREQLINSERKALSLNTKINKNEKDIEKFTQQLSSYDEDALDEKQTQTYNSLKAKIKKYRTQLTALGADKVTIKNTIPDQMKAVDELENQLNELEIRQTKEALGN